MLNKSTLDQMKCQNPDCHCRVLILSGRCHSGAPNLLYRDENNFKIACVLCFKEVASLKGRLVLGMNEEFPLDDSLFDQRCHPDESLWIGYRQYSGVLEFTCCDCEKVVAELILDE